MAISPKFRVTDIIEPTLLNPAKWFEFQMRAFEMGKSIQKYMQSYINSNTKRQGATGNLARAINFEGKTGAGMITWGVGNISILQSKAPYWYVINYGKTVSGQRYIPNHGNFVPGEFTDGAPKAGGGNARFNYKPGSGKGMFPRKSISPMNYIQAGQTIFRSHLNKLLTRIRVM